MVLYICQKKEKGLKMRDVSFTILYDITLPDDYDDMSEEEIIEEVRENWDSIIDECSGNGFLDEIIEIN